MKRTNSKLAGALTIMSFLTIAALYFEFAAMVVLTIAVILAAFIAFVAMMGTYHYCGYGYSSGLFWFAYSAVGGVIIIASIYAAGMQIVSDHLAYSLVMGLFPVIIPVIGVFLGDCGRVIFKAEPSAV